MSIISQTVQDAINEQVKNELHSAYLYLAMSAHFEHDALTGFASWMRLQAREEVTHAMKLYDYLNDRGGKVQLQAIPAPPPELGTPLQIFREAYEHEQKITALIHKLYVLAGEQNDYPTQIMLNWFIEEQVEEEKNASEIVAKLELLGESRASLLVLDHHLGKRGGEG